MEIILSKNDTTVSKISFMRFLNLVLQYFPIANNNKIPIGF